MVERILAFLNAIPADKLRHFCGGAIICALALPVGELIARHWPVTNAPAFALSMTVLAAVVKEAYDKVTKLGHVPEFMDVVATVSGAGPVLLGFICGGVSHVRI